MEIPKATYGTGSNQYRKTERAENITSNNFSKSKKKIVEELGFSTDQVSRMERLARNRDKVEKKD